MFGQPFPVSGLILAGGQGLRMGGRDKGLMMFNGKALIDHVIECLAPQVDELLISANRNLEEYSRRGYPVFADALPDFTGPLAGALAGLEHARHEWLVVCPCDAPLLPTDLVDVLCRARGRARAVVARTPRRYHYVIMMLHRDRQSALQAYLDRGGRSVKGFLESIGAATADFPDDEAFLNRNHPGFEEAG
jgi:molybdopterin-guanine dinucleotide biosynthesis protein A